MIVNTNFLKSNFYTLISTFILISSCSELEIISQSENQLELEEFINLNLKDSGIPISISNANVYKAKNYNFLTEKAGITAKTDDKLEPYSLEIVINREVYYIHTIPINESQASVIIETLNGDINEVLDLKISNFNPINDEYEILWSTIDSNKSNVNNKSSTDCKTGAASVAAAGRVIAFGGAFGCVPCAFVGGAITALGSIGYIACVITNN